VSESDGFENLIPIEEVVALADQALGSAVGVSFCGARTVSWIEGVLVDFEGEAGTFTLHHPGRQLLQLSRRNVASPENVTTTPSQAFSAAARALATVEAILPWSRELRPTIPQETGIGFRITLRDWLGPIEMPSHVDCAFLADGTLTHLSAYVERGPHEPVVNVRREVALSVAEAEVADERGYEGCRPEGASLRMRFVDGSLRTVWRISFPGVVGGAGGSGGEVLVDAETGKLASLNRYK